MKIIIVESPNKCKKIESYLGSGWIVKASVGHVRDLPEHEFGVDLESFRPTYVLTDSGKKVIGSLKKLVAQAEEVYIATDPDREGEAIGWHVKTALGIKEYKRVVFHEITKGGVLKSLRAPRKLDMNLVRAQEARRILDRLVGYSVSPCLSKAYQRPMSAGRVQSPAVHLVVARELAIRQFKSEPYLEVYLQFLDGKTPWKAKWNWDQYVNEDETVMPELWTDRVSADQAAAIRSVVVKSVESREVSRRPPPPFITSTLIQAVSVVLKMDSAEAMQVAQKLFEHGLITYHRTDNPNLSDEGVGMMRSWMIDNGLAGYIADPPNKWKAKEDAQEAHEAIRPTDPAVEGVDLDDPRLNQVYELIWKRAMACQMRSARYLQTQIQLADQKEVFAFSAQGRSLLFAGWLKLADKDFTSEPEAEGDEPETQILPHMGAGQVLNPVQGEVLEKQTRPPARYTEASLVKKMESEGIGRPATYASIMKNIKQRGYVDVKLRKFWASDLGISLIDTLKTRFTFVELDYTRRLNLNPLLRFECQDLRRVPKSASQQKILARHVSKEVKQEVI
jgi:DNA topoisomerase-1